MQVVTPPRGEAGLATTVEDAGPHPLPPLPAGRGGDRTARRGACFAPACGSLPVGRLGVAAVAYGVVVEAVGQRLAVQPREQIARRDLGHFAARGGAGAGDVRHDDAVGHMHQRMLGWQRLWLGYVE